jgi:hypothetical protein
MTRPYQLVSRDYRYQEMHTQSSVQVLSTLTRTTTKKEVNMVDGIGSIP